MFDPPANLEPKWSQDEENDSAGDRVNKAEQSLLNKLIRCSLVKNGNQVEVQQADPKSPLFSAKTFEELRLYVLDGSHFYFFPAVERANSS